MANKFLFDRSTLNEERLAFSSGIPRRQDRIESQDRTEHDSTIRVALRSPSASDFLRLADTEN